MIYRYLLILSFNRDVELRSREIVNVLLTNEQLSNPKILGKEITKNTTCRKNEKY